MSRDQLYTGSTRGREKNTIHVVTGAPDPAQPDRAEREAYADAAIQKAHELRLAGDTAAADAVSFRMPDRPSDRQMAPWEAVLAQAMQREDPEGTALEAMQAAQDFATHTGHLLELYEAFWRLDVVPKIDEMIRQRVTPGEFDRYLQDPERPAFLQVLRAHEIGGRPIPDLLDAITAEPLDGSRSIAAVLHGRAGKERAPARGATTGWAERAPGAVTPEIETAGQMLDARQAALGERLAANPPAWAIAAWGDPQAKTGAERADWERLAGIVESYREAAGITDPQQAIGPVPAGKAHLAEAFHASVRALRLPDEAALLKAMNRGQLEAQVQEYARAEAVAPADVQAQVGDLEHSLEEARTRRDEAELGGNLAAMDAAAAEAERHAAGPGTAGRSRRSPAGMARGHGRAGSRSARGEGGTPAPGPGRAHPGDGRGGGRGLGGAAGVPEIDPARLGPLQGRADRPHPGRPGSRGREDGAAHPGDRCRAREVRHRRPDAGVSPERAADEANLAEVRAELDRFGELIDRIPDREAERQAQRDEIAAEPGIRPEPEAEPSLESSWQPGEAGGPLRAPRPTSTSRSSSPIRSIRTRRSPRRRGSAPGASELRQAVRGRAIRQPDSSHLIDPARPSQDAGEPLVMPREGALQVPVVLVAVDPLPLGPQRRQLPDGLTGGSPSSAGAGPRSRGSARRANSSTHPRRSASMARPSASPTHHHGAGGGSS